MTAFSDCNVMVLLPYTPRADADSRGYEDWLREVDNPFFNTVRGIAHYSNWRVDRVLWGSCDFTHFDYMRLDPDHAAEVWTNPAVIEFAAGWTRSWGSDPDAADLSVNYHSYRLRRLAGRATRFQRETVLGIDPQMGNADASDEVWAVEEPMVGIPPASRFAIGESPPRDHGWASAAIVGTLIAAP